MASETLSPLGELAIVLAGLSLIIGMRKWATRLLIVGVVLIAGAALAPAFLGRG